MFWTSGSDSWKDTLSNDNIYSFFCIYRKTAVVGAGYIAVELAGILQELGSDTSLFIRREQVSDMWAGRVGEGGMA